MKRQFRLLVAASFLSLLQGQQALTSAFTSAHSHHTMIPRPSTKSPTMKPSFLSNHQERLFMSMNTNTNNNNDEQNKSHGNIPVATASVVAVTFMMIFCCLGGAALLIPLPVHAVDINSSGVYPSAALAYGHYLSIMAITGCLAAERILVKPNMSLEEEALIVKLDLVYGLLAALLIGSGVIRANANGDFYIHEVLFWMKMCFSGIWGGLSIFPSLTFYKRNFARKNNQQVDPLSEALAARLQQIINAELTAILSIPILATLMSRGVSYWQDLPWQLGLVTAIACTAGSFYLYGKQALTWNEDESLLVEQQKEE